MQVELKNLLDELGIKTPEELLDDNLNLIWQRKYKQVQNSDIPLEEKTERLIKINFAKDKLETYDIDIIRSFIKKKSDNIVSESKGSKESKTKDKNIRNQSRFKKYYPQKELTKYFSVCKKCNGKGFIDKLNKVSKECETCLGTGLIKKINKDHPNNFKEVQLVYRGVSYTKTWNKTLNKFGKFKSFLMKLIS